MSSVLADGCLDNSWLNIDCDALRGNAESLLKHLAGSGDQTPELMAVVKANGYGHGTVHSASAFRSGGARWFGVTSLVEAKELIEAGFNPTQTPILVFAPLITLEQANYAIRFGLHVTVCDLDHVKLIRTAANAIRVMSNVHLKIDTGMSRLGLLPVEAGAVAREVESTAILNLTGVYTHFATANEKDLSRASEQLTLYKNFCNELNRAGITGFLQHCANSSALLRLPESRFNIVRAGTILYGQYPSSFAPRVDSLRSDTFVLSARAMFVHRLAAGANVGYGAEAKTARPTIAAVLQVGFADGVSLQPASLTSGLRGLKSVVASIVKPTPMSVNFDEFNAPVLGRIGMQMMVVDVTDSPGPICAGSVATVPVRRLSASSRIPRFAHYSEAKVSNA
jgi:alanine racemase